MPDAPNALPDKTPIRLLIVGGGHATVALLKRAEAWVRAGIAVTLLNDHPALYYSGMVPEYLGGVYRPEEVQIDLRAWCRRTGVRWVHGCAVGLEVASRTVVTSSGERLEGDVVVFDVGARNPELTRAADAIQTKPLHHVERLAAFLRDALAEPHAARSLVIAGGGAAGVEVALNVSGRVGTSPHPGVLRLTLVEPSDRLLTQFPPSMGRYAERLLRQRGVALHCSTRIVRASGGQVALDSGEKIAYDAVLWATGSVGQPLFAEAGLACDDEGFVKVSPMLQCPMHPWLFAAGDCAAVKGYEDLAKVGVHAVKQGPLLHRNVDRALRCLQAGRPLEAEALAPFRPYPLAPLILSTGTPAALFVVGGFWLRGALCLRLKHLVDLRWIEQYQPSAPYTLPEKLHLRAASPL